MYVVGANLLSDHWRAHPETEGELRALHALLAAIDCAALPGTLGKIADFDMAGADIRLGRTVVRLEISPAAGVGRYASVAPHDEEGEG
jgi:hypothetical protein